MEERICRLGFAMCYGIGPAKFQLLLSYFDTAKNAWNATASQFEESGIGKAAASSICEHRKKFSPTAYNEQLQKQHVDFITKGEACYPKLLGEIKNPPYLLFIKGNKDLLQLSNFIAVVGTRKVTDYGRLITEMLTRDLASAGFGIVSGLAIGVDAIAHKAALEAGARTIAVLGCGIDCCSPRENSGLYAQIIKEGGLIISEYGLGVLPNKGTFPARNRIIAGLSLGVLVTEGAEDSGSLITANDAFANGRKVFAVPGPITSSVSRGPIALITKGAKIVTTAKDILDELGSNSPSSGVAGLRRAKGDTEEEQRIIDLLLDQNLHFDELVKKTGFDSSHVGTLLSLMEMKGLIIAHASGMFGLIS